MKIAREKCHAIGLSQWCKEHYTNMEYFRNVLTKRA